MEKKMKQKGKKPFCLQQKPNQMSLPLTGHAGVFLRAFKEAAGQTV